MRYNVSRLCTQNIETVEANQLKQIFVFIRQTKCVFQTDIFLCSLRINRLKCDFLAWKKNETGKDIKIFDLKVKKSKTRANQPTIFILHLCLLSSVQSKIRCFSCNNYNKRYSQYSMHLSKKTENSEKWNVDFFHSKCRVENKYSYELLYYVENSNGKLLFLKSLLKSMNVILDHMLLETSMVCDGLQIWKKWSIMDIRLELFDEFNQFVVWVCVNLLSSIWINATFNTGHLQLLEVLLFLHLVYECIYVRVCSPHTIYAIVPSLHMVVCSRITYTKSKRGEQTIKYIAFNFWK